MAPILLRSGRLLGVGLSFGFSLIGSTTLPHSSFCFIFKGCQINPKRGAPCQSLTHSWPLHFLPKGIYYSILFGMAQKTEPQFTLDQLEDKVLRMVEIAALTTEKLATMKIDQNQEEIAALGSEYIALAKDIKIALREHVNKMIDIPITMQPANSIRDHRELEVWTLKTEMVLKQLSVLSNTFHIPLPTPFTPAESAQSSSSMSLS